MNIKKMLDAIKSNFFTKHEFPQSDEVHDLKNKLASASVKTVIAANEYKKTMKKFRRDDVIYQIGVFTGNVRRS